MFGEIRVNRESVFTHSKMNPIGFNFHRFFSFLQEDNIRYNICSRISFESIIRQTDSAEQVSSLSKIFTDFGCFRIHRVM